MFRPTDLELTPLESLFIPRSKTVFRS